MKRHPRFSHPVRDAANRRLRFSYETLKILDPDLLVHALGGYPSEKDTTVSDNPDVSKGACQRRSAELQQVFLLKVTEVDKLEYVRFEPPLSL